MGRANLTFISGLGIYSKKQHHAASGRRVSSPRKCARACVAKHEVPASETTEQTTASGNDAVRRTVVTSVAMGLMAAYSAVTVSGASGYGLEEGRLEKCRGDVPCISTTSVGNPGKFGPPWSYQPQTGDADEAWASLKEAIKQNNDNGSIVEQRDGPDVYYLHAEFPSSWRGVDDVEFRLVKADSLVSYRSASREAIFIYPLQTPVNTNKNRTRLEDIRLALGWEEFDGSHLYGDDAGTDQMAPSDL